jgi:hypothetical protein
MVVCLGQLPNQFSLNICHDYCYNRNLELHLRDNLWFCFQGFKYNKDSSIARCIPSYANFFFEFIG